MRDRGILQEAAAAEIGTSQQTLSKWMNGVHSPSDAYLPAIARFLDVSEDRVRALLPKREPSVRMTSGRRLIELEERFDRLALRVAALAERVENLSGRIDALRDD